ncbi:hypothetical protein WICANDRAFT_50439 [Wickerhamomyces anomalus NRRL Y-366-8]|uniref:Septum-promoting GTP-binding protein 1 n=1 Tax=Wickerhamomyces anomalus (strain ATCC 58044 / CBS 1984 / NCYC 433 / NRRL Y-366-8) TaxID=683960 RepID=A0A1E3PCV0_WICAA|nr:uncharacterized protein WICANDRAFT_50439 [Wickerhamomyces anomalus NRRL Y-366-8]ODQ62707.1 hypothetical protein WICANDRAFT_50439 [Wickerhamomyces anomalus NRRL Y-366-8]
MSRVQVKVALIGDSQIGKTSLMVKYVNNSFDEDYKKTLGVNFMEKSIELGTTDIKFSVYDLGGAQEFVNMLPLTTDGAVAVVFLFDLTKLQTLSSIKEWFKLVRAQNKTAIPMLVGTKYDLFLEMPKSYQEEVTSQSLKYAKAMKSSLIFTSSSNSINVQKVFKILTCSAFDLQISIPEISNVGEPILLYKDL